MRESRHRGRSYLQFESLVEQPGLRHLFSTRDATRGPGAPWAGNVSLSGGRDAARARAERALWSECLGVDPGDWVAGGQVHGGSVTRVGAEHRGRGARSPEGVVPESDGLLTTEPGVPLYTAVADCAAVLLYAADGPPVLASVHAGWRGLRAGILGRAAERTLELASGGPGGVLAGISPCIGLPHFEVGEEVAEHAPDARRVKLGGRWHVDLAGWANDQLLASGLLQSNIEASGLDTAERADLFFSHRRDGAATGRMALVSVLR